MMTFRSMPVWLLALCAVLPIAVDGVTAEAVAAKTVDSAEASLEDEATQQDGGSENGDSIQALVDWIRSSPGGFVHESLDFTSNGVFGKKAEKAIKAKELLLSIPQDRILYGNPAEAFEGMQCGTIETLHQEMQAGNESAYAPYVNFMLESTRQVPGVLPSLYTEAGKALVRKVVGSSSRGGAQRLPPEDITGWINYEYIEGCGGSPVNDSGEHTAAGWVLARSWGEKLIPLLDLVNHQRGERLINTQSNVEEGTDEGPNVQDVHVYATRTILPGEEVFTNFGMIDTPDLFRDCGIVENYPQTFHLPGPVAFMVQKGADGSTSSSWLNRPPRNAEESTEYLETELDRLTTLMQEEQATLMALPEHERTMIEKFAQSYITALSAVLDQMEEGEEEDCSSDDDDDESCVVQSSRYSDLDTEFDDTFTSVDTCDQEAELDLSHHEVIHRVQSPYQNIIFDQDPSNNNTCFMLDNIYQICTSYRPHYHEMTHYAARFMKKIKRVIFIGGGDSMLLHEVLKYPTLEMVIGLELDQTVTRNSFKYFGSQPHWDNDKVQWWFGDAAKSLLMLPKEYFGTFDLVLVDLSETVMSNTVTKGLNIMSALSLLLKQDGIFLKNEMYFHSLSKVFKHTVQLHYYGVPLVCSQCMVLGSNAIDFIHTDLNDHGVETIHEPAIGPDRDFKYVHDYMNNPSSEQHCKSDNPEVEPTEQERSPGILMIVEAENASGKLDSPDQVQRSLESAMKKAGLAVVETITSAYEGKGAIVTSVLKEGYVVARANPNEKHVALDIHLWSSFHKLEEAKKYLLNAFGSKPKDSSSFRIVAPGLFGVSTWKEDEMRKGPKFTQDCDKSSTKVSKSSIDEKALAAVLEETMSTLLLEKDSTVAVLCGSKSDSCKSVDVLKKHESVSKIIPLWSCESIEGQIEYLPDAATRKFKCEKELVSILEAEKKKVDVIVVDQSATFSMAQIMHKIVSRGKNRREIFKKDILAIAPALDSSEDWRKIFVDQLREFYNDEPGFKSSVFFNGSDTTVEVTTLSSGDLHFINNLRAVTSKVEKRTGLVGDIRHVGGVEYTMQEDFEPSQFFLHDAYDQSSPYEQWMSQEPDGHQIVFQLEPNNKRAGLSRDKVKDVISTTLSSAGIKAELKEFDDLGDGSALVAAWSGGNIVVLWDGRDFIGINLFLSEENSEFVSLFEGKLVAKSLKVVLRDEMPRGRGRVVNFKKDLEPRLDPAWAMVLPDRKN